jgi:hypothetical protein
MRELVRVCEKNWVQRSGDSSGQWGRALLRAEVVREKTAWLKSLKVRCRNDCEKNSGGEGRTMCL